MKSFLLSLILTLSLSQAFSQSTCESAYMPFNKGVEFELTSYNKKDKLQSRVVHSISDVKDIPEGWRAVIGTQIYDDKDKSAFSGDYAVECRGNAIEMDMSSLLNPQMMASFSSLEVDVTGDALVIPHTLSPGQTLPDGTMQLKASTSGITMINMTLTITDRKVGKKESITTPAGTFDCIQISQTTKISGLASNEYNSTSWYAKGVGMVRNENYDRKGELDSYTELTSIKR